MRWGSPIVAARMRNSPALGTCSPSVSELDIVGPNLEEGFITGDGEAFRSLPVHRPEIEIGRGAAELAVSSPTVAGDLDSFAENHVPGGRRIGGHETEDASIAVWC